MIDRKALLSDLQPLVRKLEDDLRDRTDNDDTIKADIRRRWTEATEGGRTGFPYETWRDDFVTQSAVAWVLSTVFARFLEDNELVPLPKLSGPGNRRQLAEDERTHYFRQNPSHSDQEYLQSLFTDLAKLPGCKDLFDERHNHLWALPLSADGAHLLVTFWQKQAPDTGDTIHDFTDPDWDTRFLGDLYQDLSEHAKKRYALLQTPDFVEEFILDRTLTPAIDEFGYEDIRLIDPTCGSGHFLIGAFHRLFTLWQRNHPDTNPTQLAQNGLNSIHGVDLNPFAVAIARFRLLLCALKVSGITQMKQSPDFRMNLACGDSLLYTIRGFQKRLAFDHTGVNVYYETEDAVLLSKLLRPRYHAVVGNPPYIQVKDPKLNLLYRKNFSSCSGKYALSVPFLEAFFDLALPGEDNGTGAGYVGTITSNSFMKRSFGRKLITEILPRLDLSTLLDTSGANIPGHGTPTVILFGRHRSPATDTVRGVLGIRGEPTTPANPSQGLVWKSICRFIDSPGAENDYVTVTDLDRSRLRTHPWSLAGGGAAELNEQISSSCDVKLDRVADAVGVMAVTGEDDVYTYSSTATLHRLGVEDKCIRNFVVGDMIRSWGLSRQDCCVCPYSESYAFDENRSPKQLLWLFRTRLMNTIYFGKTKEQRGLDWQDYAVIVKDKLRTPLSIAFAFVATHNHFVLDRGGKVFNRSAPVIKLPPEATEEEHLSLLSLLNSSTACFWMKQMFYDKGKHDGGEAHSNPIKVRYEFDGTKLKQFPVPESRPLELARRLDSHAQAYAELQPEALCQRELPSRKALDAAKEECRRLRARMIAEQEELDWRCYKIYELIDEAITHPLDALPEVQLGQRAFEIALARDIAAGDASTMWFDYHGSTPHAEIPSSWPEAYRQVVKGRIEAIATNKAIRLIEKPEYKRRWNDSAWEAKEEAALRNWLLDRLETERYWPEPELQSCARLADRVREDEDFMSVAALLRGRADFDVLALVTELVEDEAVPFLPAQRYKAPGLRKHKVWEQVWELQRKEDAIDAREDLSPDEKEALKKKEVGVIPVPPKYTGTDFAKPTWWKLRGKLDVPKERFVLYLGAEREADPSPVVGWAGWTHAERVTALANLIISRREREGWDATRLTPLLAGVRELMPWLKQWHPEVVPEYDCSLPDFYEEWLADELRSLGLSNEDLLAWTPAQKTTRKKRMKKTEKPA